MVICAALVGDATCSSVYLLSVKPPQPVLMVLGSTANSVNVTWNSTCKGTCRLRYRANGTRVWTQVGSLTQLSALNCLLARGGLCKMDYYYLDKEQPGMAEASARPWGLGGESSAVTG